MPLHRGSPGQPLKGTTQLDPHLMTEFFQSERVAVGGAGKLNLSFFRAGDKSSMVARATCWTEKTIVLVPGTG